MTARLLYAGIVRLCEQLFAHRPDDREIPRQWRTLWRVGLHLRRRSHHLWHRHHQFRGRSRCPGIAIGLALQGTLSNLAAGIMLVLFRPFHIGDRIEVGGVVGTTREINLFYSELDSDDNVRVVVPNGKLWGEIVRIPSRNDTESVELKFTRPARRGCRARRSVR